MPPPSWPDGTATTSLPGASSTLSLQVESHSGVVAPLASRTGVPDGAELQLMDGKVAKVMFRAP